MGYYLQIDERDPIPIGSVSGWGAVRNWIAGLPPHEAPHLHHLALYGWEDETGALPQELSAALKSHPPKEAPVAHTLADLLETLKGAASATVVSVTDGMSAGDTQ